jgi:F0F1-type ATP synthase epsilon subunit
MAKLLLKVRINTPEKIIWEGEAVSVSSKNSEGPFDILPKHANFITAIENQAIVIRTPDKKKVEYTFPRSVLYMRDERVSIYTQI